MSMTLLSMTGPVAVAASIVYAYMANHPTVAQKDSGTAFVFPISTLSYCGVLFAIYAAGALPRNPFFPPVFFKSNIFPLLYRLYCSYTVGYRVLSGIMHQPVAFPHSDYRTGIRCLDAGSPLRRKSAPLGDRSDIPFLQKFYARGGGVVDTALWTATTTRGVVIVPVPMFADNYAYLIISLQTHKVAVVDPADPEMVLRVLSSLRQQLRLPLQLTDVLTTHKHWDHAGGNERLAQWSKTPPPPPAPAEGESTEAPAPLMHPKLRLIGSDVDRPLACTMFVGEDSPVFAVAGGGAKVRALAAPGHTRGSLIFVVGSAERDVADASPARVAVFTGDSLFCGGCGAPFETTSVSQIMKTRETFLEDDRIRSQPATGQPVAEEDVLLYVGHEYTERLLQQVVTLMTRVMKGSGSSGDPRGHRYLRIVSDVLRGVQVLRVASDGLKDASLIGQPSGTEKPAFRLPLCTMPSSLEMEKAVNPLLTVDDEVLAALEESEKEGEMDSNAVERAIYCSDHRCVFAQKRD